MEDQSFHPYIPADRVAPEMTAVSVLLGAVLAIVFGAANAYLGLRVGMTISASISGRCTQYGPHSVHPETGFHFGKQYGPNHWLSR